MLYQLLEGLVVQIVSYRAVRVGHFPGDTVSVPTSYDIPGIHGAECGGASQVSYREVDRHEPFRRNYSPVGGHVVVLQIEVRVVGRDVEHDARMAVVVRLGLCVKSAHPYGSGARLDALPRIDAVLEYVEQRRKRLGEMDAPYRGLVASGQTVLYVVEVVHAVLREQVAAERLQPYRVVGSPACQFDHLVVGSVRKRVELGVGALVQCMYGLDKRRMWQISEVRCEVFHTSQFIG